MKKLVFLLPFLGLNGLSFGQNSTSKLTFSQVKISATNPQAGKYKALELRYTALGSSTEKGTIMMDGIAYLLFPDETSAIEYFMAHVDAEGFPEKTVYYIYSKEAKSPEVFTTLVE